MNRIDCDQHKSYDKINCIRKAILVELDSTAVKQNNIIHLLLQRGLKQNLEIKTIQRFVWGICMPISISHKACGFSIVLIALTTAMNDDSIVMWWRDQFLFSIQINIWFSNINLNLIWSWLGLWLTTIKAKKTALIGLKKVFILFEGWMSKVQMLYARLKKPYVVCTSKC